MKITKKQLKRIIAEEMKRLQEQPISGAQAVQMQASQDLGQTLATLHRVVDEMISAMGYEEAALELEGIAEDIRANDSSRE